MAFCVVLDSRIKEVLTHIMTQIKKPWYQSKSKWAGILGGLSIAAPGIISWLNGSGFGLQEIWAGAIVILAVFGIRDLPILNRR